MPRNIRVLQTVGRRGTACRCKFDLRSSLTLNAEGKFSCVFLLSKKQASYREGRSQQPCPQGQTETGAGVDGYRCAAVGLWSRDLCVILISHLEKRRPMGWGRLRPIKPSSQPHPSTLSPLEPLSSSTICKLPPTVGTLRMTVLIELCAALKRLQLDALARKRESLLPGPSLLKAGKIFFKLLPKAGDTRTETHSVKAGLPQTWLGAGQSVWLGIIYGFALNHS